MKVWELYSFIWDLQESIGDGCKIQMSVPQDCILRIYVNWPDDDLHYTHEASAKYLEHMKIETLEKLLTEKINRAYRIATVGEE